MLINVFHPCREHDRKARSVSHIIESAELMLHIMRRPVAYPAGIKQIVMRKGAGPHDLAPDVIIIRLFMHQISVIYDVLHRAFKQSVRNADGTDIREVSLHHMRQNIRDTAACLIRRQRVGKFRVHDGKRRIDQIAVQSPFQLALFLCDNAAGTGFASGRGYSQYHANGERRFGALCARIEIPDVSIIRNTHGDGFSGVYRTSAADCENQIDIVLAADLDAFVYEREPGIRLHPAELDIFDAGPFQAGNDPIVYAVFLDAAAAVMKQYLFAVLFCFSAKLFFGAFAEDDLCRVFEFKIDHKFPPKN
jgi:hypothetical protein